MKRTKLLGVAVAVGCMLLVAAVGVWAARGKRDVSRRSCVPMSPMKVAGASVEVINTKTGVIVYIDGEQRDVVRRIQRRAADAKEIHEHACSCQGKSKRSKTRRKKGALYTCSMGDYVGPMTKDGRCPKCGMKLHKK